MWVRPDQDPHEEANTLLHEIMHMIWDQSGGGTPADLHNDEQLICRLTPWLQMVIVENPKLLTYLRDPGAYG